MRHRRTKVAIVLAAALLAACDAGGNGAQNTLATTATTASLPPGTSTTTAGSTSTTAAPVTAPPGSITLSADGPWKLVDSAPGVTKPGLVYELMPNLWVYLPTVEDIPNGITWTLNEDDRPVIEAYLMAQLTYLTAVTAKPIDLDLPGWAEWFVDYAGYYRDALDGRRQAGQQFSLGSGIVLRPQVLGEERSTTSAIVYDCVLDGGYFLMPDGTLAPGSTYGTVEAGTGTRLQLVDGRWKVTQVGTQVDACFGA